MRTDTFSGFFLSEGGWDPLS